MNKPVLAAVAVMSCAECAMAFDADTLAFYTFNDKPAGAEADGATITNSVDGTAYLGTAEKADYGTFTFSDDRPARYIFAECDWNAELLVEKPNSLRMYGTGNSNKSNSGGTVSFANLAEAIGGASTFTVEFFYKIIPGVTYWAGTYASVVTIPVSNASSQVNLELTPTEPYRWRFRLGSGTYTALDYPSSYNLQDGLWHHIALVYKSDGKLYAYGDRDRVSAGVAMTLAEAKNAALGLGCKAFRGYMTCLRVTKKALSTQRFMFASDRRDCIPREVFHWSLDGTAGETATVLSNRADSAAASLTSVYGQSSKTGEGTIVPASDDSRTGTYAATAPMGDKYILVDSCDGSAAITNGGGVAISATPDPERAIGPQLRLPVGAFYRVMGDFTFEAFMRLDHAKWTTVSSSSAVKSVMLMGMEGGNTRTAALRLGLEPSTTPGYGRFSLLAAKQDWKMPSTTGAYTALLGTDGKWHHVCITYDSSAHILEAHVDYTNNVCTLELDQGLMTPDMTVAYYCLGSGLKFAAGDLEIDEVRLSRKLLSPDEMLHFRKPQKGLVMTLK